MKGGVNNMNRERNKIIANNIRKYLKEANMSQKELANLIKISPSTLSDYLNLRSNPSHGVIQRISDVFGIMKSDIDTTYKEFNDITEIYSKLTSTRQRRVLNYANKQLLEQNNNVTALHEEVCVYGYASAGTGETLHEEVQFTVPIDGYVPSHDLALQVNGDSMEPLFEDKEIIFIEKTTHINNGQIGVFIIDNEAYIKKVFVEDEKLRLVSLNKKYDDIYFTDQSDIKLVGKVIL